MFQMLSCFNLKRDVALCQFRQSVSDFTSHLEKADLILSAGPIGRRQSDTIMDTDSERNHEFFFILFFRDRAQCDRAVEHITSLVEPADAAHKAVYASIRDQVFICWEDI